MKANNPIKRQTKPFNRYFTKENTQISNKHIKRCWTSLPIREIQIKTI